MCVSGGCWIDSGAAGVGARVGEGAPLPWRHTTTCCIDSVTAHRNNATFHSNPLKKSNKKSVSTFLARFNFTFSFALTTKIWFDELPILPVTNFTNCRFNEHQTWPRRFHEKPIWSNRNLTNIRFDQSRLTRWICIYFVSPFVPFILFCSALCSICLLHFVPL